MKDEEERESDGERVCDSEYELNRLAEEIVQQCFSLRFPAMGSRKRICKRERTYECGCGCAWVCESDD